MIGIAADRDLFRPEAIAAASDVCGFEADARAAVLQAAGEIDGSPALRNAAWHYYDLLFRSGEDQSDAAKGWPRAPLASSLGDRLLYLVVCLAGVHEIRRQHAVLGISDAVTAGTLGDIRIWLRGGARDEDWAFDNIDWLARHCQLRLFRIGRLQIELAPFPLAVRLLEHAERRWVVAIENGRVVDPRGRVLSGDYSFDGAAWTPLVKAGDIVALAHLPQDGTVGFGDLHEHVRMVPGFLRTYFPDHRVRAFYIDGWPLDPALESVLPARMPLVRTIRVVYHLRRTAGSDRPIGRPVASVDDVEPETRLQKAIVGAIRAGVTFRGSSALLPFDRPFGVEHVRTQFDDWRQAHGG